MPQGAPKKKSKPLPGRAHQKSRNQSSNRHSISCAPSIAHTQTQSRCQPRKNKPVPPKPRPYQIPFERASRAIAAQVERDVRGRAEAGGCRPLSTSDRPRKRPTEPSLDPVPSSFIAQPPNKRARTASASDTPLDSIADPTCV